MKYYYTIGFLFLKVVDYFVDMWITFGKNSVLPCKNAGLEAFPQEFPLCTKSYPQVWITLGISPFLLACQVFSEQMFCGKINYDTEKCDKAVY